MLGIMGTIAGAAVIGLAVGVLAGTLGVGGGTVLLPVFRLVFGMSAVGCTATSLFTIIPTSISGAISHIRNKTCAPKLGLVLGIGGALTSWIGVRLAQIAPSWVVMFAAALVIAYSGTTMLRKALDMPKGASGELQGPPAGRSARPQEIAQAPELTPKKIAQAALIGAIAGIASGFIGLGGGFLMIPMMLSVLHMPMKTASGTSLIAIMILATPATVIQCVLGNVDLLVGVATACGSIPGAIIGAKLVKRLPERALRFAFSGFLLVGAILLVVKETGALG